MPYFDKKTYNFYNTVTKETFRGLRKDFCKKYNVTRHGVSLITSGKQDQHNGWTLVQKAFLDRVEKSRKRYVMRKLTREEIEAANVQWEAAQKNLRMWQAREGVNETATIKELREEQNMAHCG